MDEMVGAARAGDREAFAAVVAPHRAELLVHCYRMLGSYDDAEDVLQETLLAGWLGLAGFEGRSSVRTWLYRIATHRCLNYARSASRRPRSAPALTDRAPQPTSDGEVVWLQPIGEMALSGLPDSHPGPEARYEMREAVALAFIRALQLLPSQQRAVLVLRDVLGYSALETADLLDVTVDAANGALKRARATLKAAGPAAADGSGGPGPGPVEQRGLLDTFVARFTAGDVTGVVDLLADDVWARMPPLTLEYHGRSAVAAFLQVVRPHALSLSSMVPVSCNGQPGWGEYVRDPATAAEHLTGVLVLDLRGTAISALTRFESGVGVTLGLPRTLAVRRWTPTVTRSPDDNG